MTKSVSALLVALLVVGAAVAVPAQTIEQQLVVTNNTEIQGGAFQVAVQVKSTGLGAANTLYTATIDVTYDNTKLTYVNTTNQAFGLTQGYQRSASNNTTFIRLGILTLAGSGPGHDDGGGGVYAGFDVGESYTTWALLNFTIADASQGSATNLSIVTGAGTGVTIYQNHGNTPVTDVARSDVSMSAPVNLQNVPLPIELSSFQAVAAASGRAVRLSWRTLSEVNNYGFEVQRSAAPLSGFTTLAGSFQAGHGTTLQEHAYDWTDAAPTAGEPWYRLKQTDLDQTVHYSEAEQVSGLTAVEEVEAAPRIFQLLQNYPNPFNPTTRIKFSVASSGRTSVKLYSVLGQEVATLFEDLAEAGRYYRLELDGRGLASGIYLYRLVSGEKSDIKRLVLLR